ncbi:MAG: PLP-dependent aminotransferase family protein, partial [Phyllobacteriaceae bacterium]|nr:PLP-dependent aminotransferase family protein [Phyllobacteriaceae bacterium]
KARAARDALVAGLRAAGLAVEPPDQGLHLVVPLPDAVDDTAPIAPLAAAGLGARALSTTAVGPARRRGLVVGFSGWPAEDFTTATRNAAPILAALAEAARR